MRIRLNTPPLAWMDETCPEGAFLEAGLEFREAEGILPACVTVTLGGHAVALSFPLIEALSRLASKADGYDAAHLSGLENGDVLEVGALPARLPIAFDVIEGGRQ